MTKKTPSIVLTHRLWQDKNFVTLSPNAQRLYFYLHTCWLRSSYENANVFPYSMDTTLRALAVTRRTLLKAMVELEGGEWVRFEPMQVTLLPIEAHIEGVAYR